jgi:hypothetical protein
MVDLFYYFEWFSSPIILLQKLEERLHSGTKIEDMCFLFHRQQKIEMQKLDEIRQRVGGAQLNQKLVLYIKTGILQYKEVQKLLADKKESIQGEKKEYVNNCCNSILKNFDELFVDIRSVYLEYLPPNIPRNITDIITFFDEYDIYSKAHIAFKNRLIKDDPLHKRVLAEPVGKYERTIHGLSPQSSLTSNQVKSSAEKPIKTKLKRRASNDSFKLILKFDTKAKEAWIKALYSKLVAGGFIKGVAREDRGIKKLTRIFSGKKVAIKIRWEKTNVALFEFISFLKPYLEEQSETPWAIGAKCFKKHDNSEYTGASIQNHNSNTPSKYHLQLKEIFKELDKDGKSDDKGLPLLPKA